MGRRQEQTRNPSWGKRARRRKLLPSYNWMTPFRQSSFLSAVPQWVKSQSLAAICGVFCSHDTRMSLISPSTGLAAHRPLTARRRKRASRSTSETGKCAGVLRGVSAPAKRHLRGFVRCRIQWQMGSGRRPSELDGYIVTYRGGGRLGKRLVVWAGI